MSFSNVTTYESESELTRHTQRARDESIKIKPAFVVTSGKDNEFSYYVVVTDYIKRTGTCTCYAGMKRNKCKHLAACITAVRKQKIDEVSNAARALAKQRNVNKEYKVA